MVIDHIIETLKESGTVRLTHPARVLPLSRTRRIEGTEWAGEVRVFDSPATEQERRWNSFYRSQRAWGKRFICSYSETDEGWSIQLV